MLLLIGLPMALAGLMLLPALRATSFKYAPAALCAALFAIFAGYIPAIQAAPVSETWAWVPALGLDLAFYADGLAVLFALLITGVGAVVALYAAAYFEDDPERANFAVLMMAFMSAMLGVVLAGNVLTLFCMWELTSVTSFFLIGFKGAKDEDARKSALRALIVTGAGGLALLAGLVLMGTAAGSYTLTDVLASDLRAHPWYAAMTVLVLLGAFTKSAQVPFHFWLPGAMSAPSPASAYLHAATMVKAGVYLLLRMYPVLGNTDLWTTLVVTVGLITFVWGAYVANRQRDMKGLLAYTTVSALGSLVALVGLPDSLGIKAALVGIIAHGSYKAALFLITGAVEHATGTRNMDQLGGLRHSMPGAFAVAGISALSMAGLPPLLGFIAKDSFLEAHFPEPLGAVWPFLAAFIGSALMVSAALTFVWDAFIRKPPPSPKPTHHPTSDPANAHGEDDAHALHTVPMLALAPGILAAVTVILPFTLFLLDPLVSAVLGKETHLHLFPEHIEPLLVSLLALGVGWGLMQSRPYWANAAPPRLPRFTASASYDSLIKAVEGTGDVALKLQSGRIRYYLAIILGALSMLIVYVTFQLGDLGTFAKLRVELFSASDVVKIALLGLMVVATLISILNRNHLVAVLALGVGGYAMGGVFLLEPAPDVALVQILVETLGTVMLMLMLSRMDTSIRERAQLSLWDTTWKGRWRDIAISSVIGVAIGFVALTVVVQRPERAAEEPIAVWHLLNSYPEIKVTDAVGAIVTDFRGMDTFFEIAVFATAALGVMLMLKPPASVRDAIEAKLISMRHESTLETPLTIYTTRFVLIFALMVAFSHWLYGGGQPGDGFTAGVIASLAISLSYIVRGYVRTRMIFPWLKARRFILAGLTLALGNAGLYALVLGNPFLGVQDFGNAPAGLHFSSTMIFELAIGLTVFGAVTMIMDTIAHPGVETDEG